MERNAESLLFKFAVIFVAFTLIALAMSGIATYAGQTRAYKAQREESIQQVASYLEELLVMDGEDFALYQDFFLEHCGEMRIPYDFSGDCQPEREAFETLFADRYPGRVLGTDITFGELDYDVQMAYAMYNHEYYLNMFEKAAQKFNIIYAYYLVPTEEYLHMIWMIDALREKKEVDGVACIELGVDVYEPLEEHRRMWEAWNAGRRPSGYDYYDNELGRTYAYYTPLFIGGRKLGVIGVEVEIAAVNKAILHNAVRQMAGIGIVLALCMAVMLWVIYRRYISKLEHLKDSIREYTQGKDPGIAGSIERDVTGRDEIAVLSMQVSAMILELENYMRNLLSTTQELRTSQQQAAMMNELAFKDALTGIRNKAAYDQEVARVEWAMEGGGAEFGIAMVDLNFLKRINDTFGHEQGNTAIKTLCAIVCEVFAHSPVFRIGGDEFVVLLENGDYRNAEALAGEFNARLAALAEDDSLQVWERVSASIGIAFYDPAIDSSVANVFKRADKAMYQRKKEMKAVREV